MYGVRIDAVDIPLCLLHLPSSRILHIQVHRRLVQVYSCSKWGINAVVMKYGSCNHEHEAVD